MKSGREWSDKDARKLTRALSSFEFPKLLRRTRVLDFLKSQGYPNLARKLEYFVSNTLEIRDALKDAQSGIACLHCRSRYKGGLAKTYRVVCNKCLRSPEGKETSSRNRGSKIRLGHARLSSLDKSKALSRRKATLVERFGVDNAMKSHKLQRKAHKTCLRRYGVMHSFQSENNKAKTRKTYQRRYGKHVTNAMHVTEFFEKMVKTSKSYVDIKVDGKRFRCQGYEKYILPMLVRKFGVSDVVGQFEKDLALHFEELTYRPDAWIRSKDTYIEVKSWWTLLGEPFVERNKRIFSVLSKNGIKYKIYVFNGTLGKLIPDDWYTYSAKQLAELKEKI